MLARTHFHPYDPRFSRRLLASGAVVCLGMAGWAVRNALAGVEPWAWVRAGVALLLALGFAAATHRLRPRSGWGVLMTPTGLSLAAPLRGGPAELLWQEVRALEWRGRHRDRLVMVLEEGQQLVIPRQLFASRAAFEALAREVEDHLPRPPFDA